MRKNPFSCLNADGTTVSTSLRNTNSSVETLKQRSALKSGTLGMEFFLEKTLAQLNQAGTRLNWSWEETFLEFQNVLGDSYRTTWHEVFNEHFPDPLEEVSTHLRNKKEDFDKRLSSLSRRYLIIESPGTYSISTWPPEAITASQRIYLPCRPYTRIALKRCLESPRAPSGGSDELSLQWYYMSYHENNRKNII